MRLPLVPLVLFCTILDGSLGTWATSSIHDYVLPFKTQFRRLDQRSPTLAPYANIAALSRARAASLTDNYNVTVTSEGISFPVKNAYVTYTASVGIGSPPTQYELLIDTGSSNTWCGAGKAYIKTSTSKNTGEHLAVSYGSGMFKGDLYTDTVTLAPKLTIKKQFVGAATSSAGLDPYDGILGIGPVRLTEGTVVGKSQVLLPTVTDQAFSTGVISSRVLSVYYVPAFVGKSEDTSGGELTFGGVDFSKVDGPVHYSAITSIAPAKYYWGIDANIQIGSGPKSGLYSGIVDTGTTLVLVASDFFESYLKSSGGTLDKDTGLITVTAAQYRALKPLTFSIGPDKNQFTMNPNAQLLSRKLNTALGGQADKYYLIVSDIGAASGSGLDFILGYTFLERFYTVYDTGKSRIGFGKTQYTSSNSN